MTFLILKSAKILDIPSCTVHNIIRKFRESGDILMSCLDYRQERPSGLLSGTEED